MVNIWVNEIFAQICIKIIKNLNGVNLYFSWFLNYIFHAFFKLIFVIFLNNAGI